jgi:hypothetical protein
MRARYQFDDLDELQEALNGEWGEEAQGQAEEVYDALEAQEQQSGLQEMLEREVDRVERHVGRDLTTAEVKYLVDQVPHNGEMPDLMQYADGIKDRVGSEKSRVELTAEAAADARLGQGGDATEYAGYAGDRGGDGGYEELTE